MKIYLLYHYMEYEFDDVIGIYSTLDKAKEGLKQSIETYGDSSSRFTYSNDGKTATDVVTKYYIREEDVI